MEKEKILKQIETYLKKYLKNEKHILEAFNIIAFSQKQKNIDTLTQYITATSLLLLSYLLAFLFASIFNCLLAVNLTSNPFSILNLIILAINVTIFSLITSPINFSYLLMIFNDFYKDLQSDLSNLFFFLVNTLKKIPFFISVFILNSVTLLTFLILSFSLGFILSKISLKIAIILFFLIIFYLLINLIGFNITALLVFIKKTSSFINSLLEYEKIQYQYTETPNKEQIIKEFEIKDIYTILQDTLLTTLEIFFKNYFKLILTTLFSISGILLLGFGIVFTFSIGTPAIAVLIRKNL